MMNIVNENDRAGNVIYLKLFVVWHTLAKITLLKRLTALLNGYWTANYIENNNVIGGLDLSMIARYQYCVPPTPTLFFSLYFADCLPALAVPLPLPYLSFNLSPPTDINTHSLCTYVTPLTYSVTPFLFSPSSWALACRQNCLLVCVCACLLACLSSWLFLHHFSTHLLSLP